MNHTTISPETELQNKTLEALEDLKNHPWHYRNMKRMRPGDMEIAREFLRENGHFSRTEFEFKLNRKWMDNPDKPKRWILISEVTSAAHFKIHGFAPKKEWRHPFDPE